MPRIFVLLVGFGASWILSVSLVSASGEPSAGARGMPGAVGTFEFQPSDWMEGTTSWWKDSDGVDPDVAGCHIGTDQEGQPNGRMFGEACLADGLLVESNPGAGVPHSHSNDEVIRINLAATSGVSLKDRLRALVSQRPRRLVSNPRYVSVSDAVG